jgi:CPA2 family monovalent cation:H+ antiporter-2
MAWQFNTIEILFLQALALLVSACVFVPVCKKFGLGTVLGYLIAGIFINYLFSGHFSEHPDELLHFAEFGVVLFLFVIGLELNPHTLWNMRKDIFGLGLLQMLVTTCALMALALLFGLNWQAALVIASGFALSSTAIVMTQLEENNQRFTLHGRKSFSILLFQDLAIVPLLLMVSLLAPTTNNTSFSQALVFVGIAVTAIVTLILIGKFLLSPIFRWLAKHGSQEIMTACALAIVLAAAMLMDLAGMSYAMGAFIAGVMLAESDYRHELEANIEPFRGLFLGLFFMAVGLSIDLEVVTDNLWIILILAPGIMLIKTIVLYLVSRILNNSHNTSIQSALSLAQLGEFGFVLLTAAATAGLLDSNLSSLLIAIISVTMALSPLSHFLLPLLTPKKENTAIEENFDEAKGKVLIIGFGRFGQVVSQSLFAEGMTVTILDNDSERIEEAKKFGFKVFYGDGRRREILKAAGIKKVQAVIVVTDNKATNSGIIELVQQQNPKAKIYARSYDRVHSVELYSKHIEYSIRETFESALALSEQALLGLGINQEQARVAVSDIRSRDLKRLKEQVKGDMYSGQQHLLNKPIKPEPLK